MIDGARRGYLAGAATARQFPCLFSDAELAELARFVLGLMKRRGEAHLVPEEQFLAEFPRGFRQELSLSQSPHPTAS